MRVTSRNQAGRQPAFSLLELLAVVTILGVIAVVVVPRIATHGHYAKVNVCKQYKADLNSAIENYFADTGLWVTDLSVLGNTDYYPAEIPVCPVAREAYSVDITTFRITGHNH